MRSICDVSLIASATRTQSSYGIRARVSACDSHVLKRSGWFRIASHSRVSRQAYRVRPLL
jgi:hypothetical protein